MWYVEISFNCQNKKIKLRKIHYILEDKLEPIADMINKTLWLKTTLKYSK